MTIGVQTFTVRKEQKRDLAAAYRPLVDTGIRDVEIARIDFTEQNAQRVRTLGETLGIRPVSIQVKPKYVFGDVEGVSRFCQIAGCTRVVISMLPFSCILGKEEAFYSFLSRLDEQYERYRERGIVLAYHHHNWEYVTLSNGKTRMQELLERTRSIRFVHDTYWTARSGVEPARQIAAFGDRLLGVHLRDLAFRKRLLDVVPHDAPLGDGVIDFGAVLDAVRASGCEYMVIEQNSADPYADIAKSYRYITSSFADRL